MAEAKKIHKEQTTIPPPLSTSSVSYAERVKHPSIIQTPSVQVPKKINLQGTPVSNVTDNNIKPSSNKNNANTTKSQNSTINAHKNNPFNTESVNTISDSILQNNPKNTSSEPKSNLPVKPPTSNTSNYLQPLSNQTKLNSSENTSTTSKLTHSPISQATQELIEKNNYFVVNTDPHDVEMN